MIPIEQVKEVFQYVAIGLLLAIILFWVLIAIATCERERIESDLARRRAIWQRKIRG